MVEAAPLQTPALAPSAPPRTAEAPKKELACDNDRVGEPEDVYCPALKITKCSAMRYYACPVESKIPSGRRFRPGVAAKIGACFAEVVKREPLEISDCTTPYEECVRTAVKSACVERDMVELCKKTLPSCTSDYHELCAKLLGAIEGPLRTETVGYMRKGIKAAGKGTCALDVDFNGYPFCPFCGFNPSR